MKDNSRNREVKIESNENEYMTDSEMMVLCAIAEVAAEYFVNKYGEKGSN